MNSRNKTKGDVTIDLGEYQTSGSQVFTGRDRGETVRIASRIDELIHSADHITIIIPEDIFSINPSFLEEFLSGIVRELGRDEFYKKVSFENNGEWKIDKNLDSSIDRILRTTNALEP